MGANEEAVESVRRSRNLGGGRSEGQLLEAGGWAGRDRVQCSRRGSFSPMATPLRTQATEEAEGGAVRPSVLSRAGRLSRSPRGLGTLREPWRPLCAEAAAALRRLAGYRGSSDI
jgi:hypothetical protein